MSGEREKQTARGKYMLNIFTRGKKYLIAKKRKKEEEI